jgi:ribA/ribD-fused uncharacterized protein
MLKFILIFLVSNVLLASDQEIPHYKKYTPTPIRDYKEIILDFYSLSSAYGEFSNFALFPIWVDGELYQTSEHYYQSHKFLDEEIFSKIKSAPSAYLAAKWARELKDQYRTDWEEAKDSIMEKAVYAKFSDYSVLKELLLSTGEAKIYEHTQNDCYWGDCLDRTGKNKLGQLLEKIRTEMKIED